MRKKQKVCSVGWWREKIQNQADTLHTGYLTPIINDGHGTIGDFDLRAKIDWYKLAQSHSRVSTTVLPLLQYTGRLTVNL
jgi:hypothetical protein